MISALPKNCNTLEKNFIGFFKINRNAAQKAALR